MFQNYLKTTYRNFLRQKLFSAINVIGLALGLAAFMLIMLFVTDELSYDKWVPNGENITKLEVEIPIPGRAPLMIAQAPSALIPLLPEYFSDEIEAAIRARRQTVIIRSADKRFYEEPFFVDQNFLDILEFPMISGNSQGLKNGMTSIMISEAIAKKYFGEGPAVGEILNFELFDELVDYRVEGVFKDLPENSHMDFQILAPLDLTKFRFLAENFGSVNVQAAYVKFFPGADIKSVEARFSDFYVSVAPPRDDPEGYDYRVDRKFNFINVADVHLYSDKIQQLKPGSDINTVISFVVVAFLILLIAAINYMNLATVRATQRAKEVVVRKVVGASQRNLIVQFLGEAFLISLIAMALASALVEVILPFYNDFLGKELVLIAADKPLQLAWFIVFPMVIAILGGAYPAFYLSRFKPAKVLGASSSQTGGSKTLLQSLVVFQFAISIGLTISTLIVYNQTEYARDMDLGFDPKNKIAITGISRTAAASQEQVLRQELLKLPGVTGAAKTSADLPLVFFNDLDISVPSIDENHVINTETIYVDSHFLKLFGIEPVAGRVYSEEYRADTQIVPDDTSIPITRSAVVNEVFVRQAGFATPQDAIGHTLVVTGYRQGGQALHATVVGVVSDLQLRSLHDAAIPLVFFASSAVLDVMVLNIEAANMAQTLEAIDNTWRRIIPNLPMRRYFVGDRYAALYADEEKQSQTFAAFSLFAIAVACLGLFGLAAFSADQRRKEIGIRKVHGATISIIMRLLCWQILKPVLLANFVAWPVAYLVMQNWLERFSYRIEIGPLLFVGAGCVALFIAWTTVSAQAFRVARMSPIYALREE